MYPQRLRATAIALPHPDGRKQTCAFNKKDAQISEKDFSYANRVRMQSPPPCWHRRIGGLAHARLNLPSWPRISNPCPKASVCIFHRARLLLSISGKNESRSSSAPQ